MVFGLLLVSIINNGTECVEQIKLRSRAKCVWILLVGVVIVLRCTSISWASRYSLHSGVFPFDHFTNVWRIDCRRCRLSPSCGFSKRLGAIFPPPFSGYNWTKLLCKLCAPFSSEWMWAYESGFRPLYIICFMHRFHLKSELSCCVDWMCGCYPLMMLSHSFQKVDTTTTTTWEKKTVPNFVLFFCCSSSREWHNMRLSANYKCLLPFKSVRVDTVF